MSQVSGRPASTPLVNPDWRGRIHPATAALYVAAVLVFLVSVAQFHRSTTGLTYLIDFGDVFHQQKLPRVREVPHYTHASSTGYDGQFYAQIAVDPLLRDPGLDVAIDSPPHRARRILFCWTAYVLGLGRPAWVLKAYALQNVLAWLGLAAVLLVWLPPSRPRNFVLWTGAMFGAGLINSVRYALLDGPSLLLLVLAVLAVERGRSWWATGIVALAGLGRETNLLGGATLVDRVPRTAREVAMAAGRVALVVAPLVLWALYVRSVYPTALQADLANFALPFTGYVDRGAEMIHALQADGWSSPARFSLASLVGLTTQGVFLATRWDWRSPWWRLGVGYLVLMATLNEPVWEGYPGASMRVLVPMSFAFNVLVARSRWCWPLAIVGNLAVLEGLVQIEVPFVSDWL